jgi:FAD/FMN-containing dehydrogenase
MTELICEAWPHLLVCDFGHWGDGGLHFNLVWPRDCGVTPTEVAIKEIRDCVYRTLVEEFQGSFSAEHGIGPYNQAIYERFTTPEQLQLAGALQGLTNPEALLGTVHFGSR